MFVAALYMFSDVLPPLACLSRAFQKKDIDFTMVKLLVVGTKAAVDALLLNAGELFQILPAAVGGLQQMYLSEHITARFPDIGLLEGFEIFNPSGIPEDLSL